MIKSSEKFNVYNKRMKLRRLIKQRREKSEKRRKEGDGRGIEVVKGKERMVKQVNTEARKAYSRCYDGEREDVRRNVRREAKMTAERRGRY